MKKLTVVLLFLSMSTFAQTTNQKTITELLDKQVAAWNAGDIPKFMEGYWKSDSLAFVGSKGVTYGWQNTLDGYKTRYPDKATMGTLKFEILRVQVFEGKTAFLLGKWHLTRPEKGDVGGHYTLVLRKIKGQWFIVSDHTS